MLSINPLKAMVITQERIRMWRDSEFAKNDVKIQNALADGDSITLEEARTYRDYLRDLPQMCEGKTIEELKLFMEELGSL